MCVLMCGYQDDSKQRGCVQYNKWDTHICQAHTYTNTSTDNLNVTFGAIDANPQDKQKERDREREREGGSAVAALSVVW